MDINFKNKYMTYREVCKLLSISIPTLTKTISLNNIERVWDNTSPRNKWLVNTDQLTQYFENINK